MKRSAALIAAATFLAAAPAADADLSYTLTAQTRAENRAPVPAIHADVMFKDSTERVDATIGSRNRSFHIVNVVDCSAHRIYTIDPALRIYTIVDARGVAPSLFGVGTLLPAISATGGMLHLPLPLAIEGASGMRVTVQQRGEGRLGRTVVQQWVVTETPLGEGQPSVWDVWTDPVLTQPIDCATAAALNAGGGYTITGDVDALKALLTHAPQRLAEITGPYLPMTFDRSNVSTRTLDATLFAPPAGSRQVTPGDFMAAENKAIPGRLAPTPSNGSALAAPAVPNGPNEGNGINAPGTAPTVPQNMGP